MNFTLDEIKFAMFNTLVDMGREDDTDDIILSTLQSYIILLDSLSSKPCYANLIKAYMEDNHGK